MFCGYGHIVSYRIVLIVDGIWIALNAIRNINVFTCVCVFICSFLLLNTGISIFIIFQFVMNLDALKICPISTIFTK